MRPLLLLGITLLGSAGQAETLHLVCAGNGTANKASQRTAYAQDSDGNGAWATVTGQRSQDFVDQADVEIDGMAGRIRMPRVMLPPIHGGKDGWMDIEKLSISEREITGSVGVNFMNSPKLRIDRVSGVLSMSGKAGNFVGRCRAYDPEKVKRAF